MFSDATQNPSPTYPEPSSKVPKPPIVTYVLIGMNVLIFLLTLGQNSYIWGGNNHYFTVEQGEYYRLVTAMFLHANLMHIAFNMFALYNIGRMLEGFIGHITYGIVYFAGGLAGSLLSMTLNTSNISSVGASGAVVAVFAAEIVFIYRHRQLFGDNANAALKNAFITILINLAIGLSPGLNIDNWGHLGGFIGGIIVFLFLDIFFIHLHLHPAEMGRYFLVLDIRNRGVLLGIAGGLAILMLYFLSTISPLLATRQFEEGNLQVDVPPRWIIRPEWQDDQFCDQDEIKCLVILESPSGLTVQIYRYIGSDTSLTTMNQRDTFARVDFQRDGGEAGERHQEPIDGHNAIQHEYEFSSQKGLMVFIQTDTSIVEMFIAGNTTDYTQNEDTIQEFLDGIHIKD
jgi:rhomboid protease GluP